MISHGLFQDWSNAMQELDDMQAQLEDCKCVIYGLCGLLVVMIGAVFV